MEVAGLCEYFAKNCQAFRPPGVKLIVPKTTDKQVIRMVSLVDSMLALHKQLASAKSQAQRGAIQRQIEATDREIDRLVYDLYGLTKDEIAIVEGSLR